MDINFQTDKLIVAHYTGGAGGKFLLNCLAVANQVLHMSREFANIKIKGKWTEDQSLRASRVPFHLSMKHKTHVEFDHGGGVWGFTHVDDKKTQLLNSTNIFKHLTNQNKYYFVHSNHDQYENFIHYTKCKNIIIEECDELLKIRGMYATKKDWWIKTQKYIDLMPDKLFFNMDSFLDREKFAFEIQKVFEYLDIKFHRYDCIEQLRQDFCLQQKIPVKGTSRADWLVERYNSKQK
tara:strand:+ start:212 stop:919 length:708 start_codon:yes stop_codon:yes gene_type:complete